MFVHRQGYRPTHGSTVIRTACSPVLYVLYVVKVVCKVVPLLHNTCHPKRVGCIQNQIKSNQIKSLEHAGHSAKYPSGLLARHCPWGRAVGCARTGSSNFQG